MGSVGSGVSEALAAFVTGLAGFQRDDSLTESQQPDGYFRWSWRLAFSEQPRQQVLPRTVAGPFAFEALVVGSLLASNGRFGTLPNPRHLSGQRPRHAPELLEVPYPH